MVKGLPPVCLGSTLWNHGVCADQQLQLQCRYEGWLCVSGRLPSQSRAGAIMGAARALWRWERGHWQGVSRCQKGEVAELHQRRDQLLCDQSTVSCLSDAVGACFPADSLPSEVVGQAVTIAFEICSKLIDSAPCPLSSLCVCVRRAHAGS